MEDGDSKNNLEKNFRGKSVGQISDVRDVFQPVWIRYNSVLPFIFDRRFVESKFRFVLFVGFVLWVCFFVSQIF
jgi:hypothetical protein